MNRMIEPGHLRGNLTIQPSKSASHRALICAALSPGMSTIRGLGHSQDIDCTYRGLETMGWMQAAASGGALQVVGGQPRPQAARLVDCGESGSTLRFLIPLALLGGGPVHFVGHGRLMERPMTPYQTLFSTLRGVRYVQDDSGIWAEGQLSPGDYRLPGDVSSQFVSGLLLALACLEGPSRLEMTTDLESRGYVEMTRQMQAAFGVKSHWEGKHVLVVEGGGYRPTQVQVEADWSHGAFYLTADALGSQVVCQGLNGQSAQCDRGIFAILQEMGAKSADIGQDFCLQGGTLQPAQIDASQIPDLVPILAVAACGAVGESRIHHAERLRYKECDRLLAMAQELSKLGADITETPDGLCIRGTGKLKGGTCHSHMDHRVAMALAIAAATLCEGPVELQESQVVAKSAPAFWQEFEQVGGRSHECQLG